MREHLRRKRSAPQKTVSAVVSAACGSEKLNECVHKTLSSDLKQPNTMETLGEQHIYIYLYLECYSKLLHIFRSSIVPVPKSLSVRLNIYNHSRTAEQIIMELTMGNFTHSLATSTLVKTKKSSVLTAWSKALLEKLTGL